MRLIPHIRRKRFTIFAISAGSSLLGIKDRAALTREIALRLSRYLPGTSHAASFYRKIKRTVIVWPDEWDAPADLSNSASVLSGESWDKICTHLAKKYGKLAYDPKRSGTVHFITPDRELAVFQFSAY